MSYLRFYISLLIITISFCVYSQDTIIVGKKYYYTQDEFHKLTGQGFEGDYGREDIVYSENHKRIEYCYYIDSIKKCVGRDYYLINDSILSFLDSKSDSIKYVYKKLPNGYYKIEKQDEQIFEFAEVESLIPLKFITPLITISKDTKDTLWTTTYINCNICVNRPFITPVHDLYESKINGKIYEYNKVDSIPVQLNGDSLKHAIIDKYYNIAYCYSMPMRMDIAFIPCIITKEGEIMNIDLTYYHYFDCPYTSMEIIKQIKQWGKVKPAYKNGQPVNVRWFIKVDNLTSNKTIHPVHQDTPENRKRYIKYKKQ
jgi:hypothetical protein